MYLLFSKLFLLPQCWLPRCVLYMWLILFFRWLLFLFRIFLRRVFWSRRVCTWFQGFKDIRNQPRQRRKAGIYKRTHGFPFLLCWKGLSIFEKCRVFSDLNSSISYVLGSHCIIILYHACHSSCPHIWSLAFRLKFLKIWEYDAHL